MVSFISSSEWFPRVERWSGAWLFALLTTLCFAVFVSNSSFDWFFDPTSFEKRVAIVQQNAVLERPDARVIIFGTSRAAFGLVPASIERILNRPALSVANWAYPGFGLAPYQALLNLNKSKITAGEIIVVQIDPYFALVSKWHAENVAVRNGFFTRNWAMESNRALEGQLAAIAPIAEKLAWFFHELGGQLGLVQPYRLDWIMLPSGNWEVVNGVLSDGDARAVSAIIANSYFKDKVVRRTEVLGWKQFFRSLASLNRRVILVYLPSAPTFENEETAYEEVIAENHRIFVELARENEFRLIALTSAECGLGDNMFTDPVHVNYAGRERLSECLAEMLAREFPIR